MKVDIQATIPMLLCVFCVCELSVAQVPPPPVNWEEPPKQAVGMAAAGRMGGGFCNSFPDGETLSSCASIANAASEHCGIDLAGGEDPLASESATCDSGSPRCEALVGAWNSRGC